MQLVAFGVNHFNPLHRVALSGLLAQEREIRGTNPMFVATEWSEESYQQIVQQRPGLRARCHETWPELPQGELDRLEFGVAFEADAHTAVFGDRPIVWLDDTPTNIGTYCEDRINLWKKFLKVVPPSDDNHDVVSKIAQRCRQLDQEPVDPKRWRDVRFAFRIFKAVEEQGDDGWAVAIVGWSHLIDEPESMVRLLRLLGLEVDAISMAGI